MAPSHPRAEEQEPRVPRALQPRAEPLLLPPPKSWHGAYPRPLFPYRSFFPVAFGFLGSLANIPVLSKVSRAPVTAPTG